LASGNSSHPGKDDEGSERHDGEHSPEKAGSTVRDVFCDTRHGWIDIDSVVGRHVAEPIELIIDNQMRKVGKDESKDQILSCILYLCLDEMQTSRAYVLSRLDISKSLHRRHAIVATDRIITVRAVSSGYSGLGRANRQVD